MIRGEEKPLDANQKAKLSEATSQGAQFIAYAQVLRIRQIISRDFGGTYPSLKEIEASQAGDRASANPMALMFPLLEKMESGSLTAKLGGQLEISGLADCVSEDAAAEVAKAVEALLALGRTALDAQRTASVKAEVREDGIPREVVLHQRQVSKLVVKMAAPLLNSAQVRANGNQATLAASCEAEVPPLVAAMVPAMTRAREAARRTVSMSNLKQISLAMIMYEDEHGHFPPAVLYSPDGKTPYSWRVALLPYSCPILTKLT